MGSDPAPHLPCPAPLQPPEGCGTLKFDLKFGFHRNIQSAEVHRRRCTTHTHWAAVDTSIPPHHRSLSLGVPGIGCHYSRHTHTHTHTRARARAHTHTHTHCVRRPSEPTPGGCRALVAKTARHANNQKRVKQSGKQTKHAHKNTRVSANPRQASANKGSMQRHGAFLNNGKWVVHECGVRRPCVGQRQTTQLHVPTVGKSICVYHPNICVCHPLICTTPRLACTNP